ncbi:NAD(P)/FAD-dependent oxidoreductase [Haloarchaeobius iranensis]|uniref:Glycine/D-amino acid oxidase n=1 Tax=Haloarchaeobius iranensis TaxID=996166 RepID=A0A1G9TAE2_9EURY|nr:FAD-binding oxidoreductase [Haloarchaeobius iranensis]SDM44614.1 Glycine/D-amino acid oxidase [Haloarchaeobius iranensis]
MSLPADRDLQTDGAPETVAVVGGGAVGATAAYDLSRHGVAVTLFEAGHVAGGSSGRAAGICYDAFAEDRDARVAARAIERFREFDGRGDFAFEGTPYVWLAREGDDRRADAIREQVPRMRANDRDVTLLDPDGLAAAFPTLRTDDVAVAAVARDAGVVDPATYPPLLASLAAEEGATIREATPVRVATNDDGDDGPAVVSDDGEREAFDAVLVAAGAHTKRLLADAGVPIAMKPYRVQALTAGFDRDVPVCYDATAGVYLRPHPDGLLVGDGTEEREADPDDWRRAADDWFVDGAVAAVAGRTGREASVERAWAGLCTATPDRDPLLGELRDGLFVATGFQGHGFMRAPALGEAVAAELLGGEGIEAFAPTRFDGDESFEVVEGMVVEE